MSWWQEQINEYIKDEHIYQLIEVDEIIYLIILGVINKLVNELLSTNVEHSFVGVQATNFIPDGLNKVCLAPAYSAEDNERIEGCSTRFLSHMHSCRAGNTVAITFYIVLEDIVGIKLWVYLHTLKTWNCIRSFYVVRIIPL